MTHTAALTPFLDAALIAADAARCVLRPLFRERIHIDNKTDHSPVTLADRTAERVIRSILQERFPDHGILGEEFGHTNPAADLCWVIDPLDGTRAFITGRPTFGTMIALLNKGAPVLGVIDQPISQERWVGLEGHTTRFYQGPSASAVDCLTRRIPGLHEAELSCTSPEMLGKAPTPFWSNLQAQVRRTSWGGDCYAYGLLALGYIDIIAECDMKVWDWAALVPIIEGAGGRITDWHGRPLNIEGDNSVLAVGDPSHLGEAIRHLSSLTP